MKQIKIIAIIALSLPSVAKAQMNDTIELKNVVVTGTRHETDVRHLPMTITTVSHEKLTEQHRTSILPTLNEQVPGLFTTSRGMMGYGVSTGAAGMFTMRGVGGSSPNAGMLVLIDGVPQYAGLFGHAIADAYQTMMAEKVEVLRGPASALYGSNAMGGVVNIVTRQMKQEGMKTSAQLAAGSYGTLQAEAVNRFRKGAFGSIVGLNYGRTDGHRPDSEFEQYTGFAKVGYDLGLHWRLMADVDITRFDASNPGEVSNPYIDNDQEITRGMASLNITNRYGSMSGALRAYYNWGHHEVNDGYHPGGTPQTALYMHDDLMIGVSLYESFALFDGNRTTVGADWTHFGGKAWNETIDTHDKKELADRTENEVATYVDVQQRLTDRMALHATIRIDHHSQVGTEWVPQGGVAFRLPKDIELKAMVSKGFRFPTMKEMYMFPPQNPDLKPESTMNYELAYKQTLMDGKLKVGANVFYLTGENLIMTVRNEGKPQNVNINEVENCGLELSADWRVSGHLTLNGNYSMLHMEHPVIGAPEHKAYLGGHGHWGRFSLTTGLQYIAGLYTAVGASASQEDVKENYLLWNLTANYSITPCLTVFAKGENLLAERYEVNHGFPMPKATFMGGISVEW